MNLLELVTHLRENILDDAGGQGVDWTSYSDDTFDSVQLRWRNEELVRNINEAVKQVYRRTFPVKDLIELEVEKGVNTYSLPKYVLKVLGIKREDGKPLILTDLDDLWDFKDMNSKVGDLSRFVIDDETGLLRIWPNPLKDEVLSLMVYRLPIKDLEWIDNDLSPELREEFHIPMLFYAAHLCYLKDEANTLDPNRSKSFLEMFDREFPFVSSYGNIRKSRNARRPVKYGGI